MYSIVLVIAVQTDTDIWPAEMQFMYYVKKYCLPYGKGQTLMIDWQESVVIKD